MRCAFLIAASVCLPGRPVMAQDAAKVDAKHMRVEVNNDQVRVLRYHYDPHERAAMHSHPNTIDIVLTDGDVRLTSTKALIAARMRSSAPGFDCSSNASS